MSARATPEPCRTAREWLSAYRDGEAFDDPAARGHVAGCAACRAWNTRLDAFTPPLRMHVAGEAPDVVASGAGRVAGPGRGRTREAGARRTRAAGHRRRDRHRPRRARPARRRSRRRDRGQHLGWELHAFEAALGVGFCFAAAQPDRYGRSLLPVTAAVALLTLHPFLSGLGSGAVDPLKEASHLPTLLGLAALLLLADADRRRRGAGTTRRRAPA